MSPPRLHRRTVLSALSATAARKKDYPVAKKWGWIAVSVSSVLVCTNLFIIIKSRTSAAVVTSALEEVAFGVMISSVLLLTGLCGMAVLQSISLNGLYVNDAHCGSCNVSCTGAIPNATATCRVPDGTSTSSSTCTGGRGSGIEGSYEKS